MTVKTKQADTHEIYFYTITCYNWINFFEITDFYKEIYKWFDILNQQKIR